MRTSLRPPFGMSRKPRVLLVPDQWSGSVQEYYHFVLGYLAPIALWLERHPGKPVAVRDCGPMNSWLDLLPPGTDLTIMSPGDMLHMYAGRHHRSAVLAGNDDPRKFNTRDLARFRTLMLGWNKILPIESPDSMTVIDRRTSGDFNSTAAAEVPASGSAVRSTPNLSEILQPGAFAIETRVIDAAHVPPREQLEIFTNTRVLVGQHGAGLANMVWMRPGGQVVEILPPVPDYVEPIFSNLAKACGHTHQIVRQGGDHAPVSAPALLDAVSVAVCGRP